MNMNYLKSSILVLTLGLIACGGGNTENTALDTLGAQLQMLEDTMLTEEGMSWTAADWETINGTYDSNVKLAEEGGADVAEFTTRWDAIAAKVMEATEDIEGIQTTEEDFSAEESATTENVATSANITAGYICFVISSPGTQVQGKLHKAEAVDTHPLQGSRKSLLRSKCSMSTGVPSHSSRAQESPFLRSIWELLFS